MHAVLLQFYCISMRKHNEYLQRENIADSVSEKVAAWIPDYRRWPTSDLSKENPLMVYFMNECPEEWKYKGDRIYRNFIMEVANASRSWKNCFAIGVDANNSHIRVKFHGMYGIGQVYLPACMHVFCWESWVCCTHALACFLYVFSLILCIVYSQVTLYLCM